MKRIGIRWPYAAQRKKAFDAYKKENGSDKKLPRISELNAEYAMLLERKKKLLCGVPQDQIGNAGLACGAEDCAGNPEKRTSRRKEQLHEQEVRQEEENRQSSR